MRKQETAIDYVRLIVNHLFFLFEARVVRMVAGAGGRSRAGRPLLSFVTDSVTIVGLPLLEKRTLTGFPSLSYRISLFFARLDGVPVLNARPAAAALLAR